eukprot:380687-Hanusia_phi.AAC.2
MFPFPLHYLSPSSHCPLPLLSRLRTALKDQAATPVLDISQVFLLAQKHAGITDEHKLIRALAMLQCWGVLVHLQDSSLLRGTVLQVGRRGRREEREVTIVRRTGARSWSTRSSCARISRV